MVAQINLLKAKKKKTSAQSIRQRRRMINSSVLFFVLLLIAGSGFYAFKLVLAKEVQILEGQIDQQEQVVASYRDIEERKGLLTLKTNEISTIFDSKFDYLQAIDDAQQLFGYSIEIDTIDITKEGIVTIESRKVSDITLSEEQAFATTIKNLDLTITVPTSQELEETIDTLLGFEGKGLSSVIVTSTSLNEEVGGYEVSFSISFENSDPVVPGGAPPENL